MSKGPSTFRKTDVKRAFDAAKMAGVKVARIEIQAGKITLVPRDDSNAKADAPDSVVELNDWLAKKAK